MVAIRGHHAIRVGGITFFRGFLFTQGSVTGRLVSKDAATLQGSLVPRNYQGNSIIPNVLVRRLICFNHARSDISFLFRRIRRSHVSCTTAAGSFGLFQDLGRLTDQGRVPFVLVGRRFLIRFHRFHPFKRPPICLVSLRGHLFCLYTGMWRGGKVTCKGQCGGH